MSKSSDVGWWSTYIPLDSSVKSPFVALFLPVGKFSFFQYREKTLTHHTITFTFQKSSTTTPMSWIFEKKWANFCKKSMDYLIAYLYHLQMAMGLSVLKCFAKCLSAFVLIFLLIFMQFIPAFCVSIVYYFISNWIPSFSTSLASTEKYP